MKFIQIIFLVTLILSSCKKSEVNHERGPDCSDTQTKYISPDITNFKFKKGTYWVYIDSVSLVTDTVIVDTVLYDGLKSYSYCPNNYYEKYLFIVRNRDYSVFDKYFLNHGRIQLNSEAEEVDKNIYEDHMPKVDSVFIFNTYYKSVVIYTKINDPNESWNKTLYYSNTEYGFLKKEIYNPSNQLLSKKLLIDKFIVR